ncbi:MAG TPA: hypothetical protein VMV79_01100 [Alphaproteobacteria bacterium]|nr:hypothetical protein [Alphaproteobacteria bacterium]
MTDDYVQAKIRDSLASTGGNRHDAQKLLITWAVRDQALLLGMAKPHLKAIAAALIDHALRRTTGDEGDSGPEKFSPAEIDQIVGGGRAAREKRRAANIPPPKSTERQANAMRKLAAAFTRKKK